MDLLEDLPYTDDSYAYVAVDSYVMYVAVDCCSSVMAV